MCCSRSMVTVNSTRGQYLGSGYLLHMVPMQPNRGNYGKRDLSITDQKGDRTTLALSMYRLCENLLGRYLAMTASTCGRLPFLAIF